MMAMRLQRPPEKRKVGGSTPPLTTRIGAFAPPEPRPRRSEERAVGRMPHLGHDAQPVLWWTDDTSTVPLEATMSRPRHAHAPLPADSTLAEAIADYQLAARAEGLSRKTIGERVGAATWLAVRTALSVSAANAKTWADITKRHVQEHLAWLQEQYSPSYCSNQYRALRAWFKWLEGEFQHGQPFPNPMAGLKPPTVPPKLVPVITRDALSQLLDFSGSRNNWEKIRDQTIILLFASSGARRQEIAALKVDDVNLDDRVAVVTGKGRKPRLIRFSDEAARSLARYLRARRKHRHADLSDALWLGKAGPMTGDGVYQMIKRRAAVAGVDIHPHQFRHTFSHEWLLNGGSEGDLMSLNGWSSASMVRHYGASAASARAVARYDAVMANGRKRRTS